MLSAYQVEEIRRAEADKGDLLMERAAFAIASRSADLLIDLAGAVYGSTVVLLVGPGANGGDALFAGAHLARRGAQVIAICTHERWHQPAMAAFRAAGGSVRDLSWTSANVDLVIDGIYGMGSRGPLDPSLAASLPGRDAFILSVDLPSGVDADTGVLTGAHVDADLTLATGALKPAHLIDPSRSACGVIEVIDLGLELGTPAVAAWQREEVAAAIGPGDPILLDKYRRGVLALDAGSTTYPGAGQLAALGAINIGVGMIRHLGAVDLDIPEVVQVDGTADALAIGPGLTEEDRDRVVELLSRDLPAVVDAGAIAWVENGRPHTVLTPHAGELARLLGVDRDAIERERWSYLRRAVDTFGVTILLKGSTTLVATPQGQTFANLTGSPALATAGSGDVLTGMIGGLMARGLDPTSAAVSGAWLHGIAGAYAQSGASGIAEMIPAALSMLADDHS